METIFNEIFKQRVKKALDGSTWISQPIREKRSRVRVPLMDEEEGLRGEEARGKGNRLRRLMRLGADLLDPESVKEVIARQGWSCSGREE
ncbi:MAG: hypothetical protein ACP5QI_07615 [Candidatus Bathyarchaeia archaeon]